MIRGNAQSSSAGGAVRICASCMSCRDGNSAAAVCVVATAWEVVTGVMVAGVMVTGVMETGETCGAGRDDGLD